VDVDRGVAEVVAASPDVGSRRRRLWPVLATGVVWLAGSAAVVVAQHGSDRRLAALAAAGAGIAAILALTWLTPDRDRRYLRSVVGATIAVSLTSDWMLWQLGVATSSGAQQR